MLEAVRKKDSLSHISSENLKTKEIGTILEKRDEVLRTLFFRWKVEYLYQQCVTGVKNNQERLHIGDIVMVRDKGRGEY